MIKENSYFSGGVKSLGFSQQDEQLSVGVMAPGEYNFATAAAEKMTVVKGALTIRLAGETEWQSYQSGEAFDVPSDSSFDVKVEVATAYLCEYIS